MQKKPIIFALAWAAATMFIAHQFENTVVNIAQSAADQAATLAVKEIQERSNRFCRNITIRNPSYDSDELANLCNAVSLLSEGTQP